MHFTVEEIIDLTETWLIKGDLNPDMLAENFQFISPFWKGNNKAEFIDKFLDPTEYKKLSLSNITKFDPLLQFKGLDGKHFSIILQYHTKNGSSVWEAVLGTVEDGMLVELRSIYDLEATKKAHGLEEK
jgi:hypothetical protein